MKTHLLMKSVRIITATVSALCLTAASPVSTSDAGWIGTGAVKGVPPYVWNLTTDKSGNIYANVCAQLDGSRWQSTDLAGCTIIKSIAIAGNGVMYATGIFDTTGCNIAQFIGGRWKQLDKSVNGDVHALAIANNGDLYAAGAFDSAGDSAVSSVARWNGSTWTAVGGGVKNGPGRGTVWAMTFDRNGVLYAGGEFTTAGGLPASNIARWNGYTWSSLGPGLQCASVNNAAAVVRVMAFDDRNNLYAGGSFDSAGTVAAHNIARWDGSAWSSPGPGYSQEVNALWLDENGALHAAGTFDTAGGAYSAHYAMCKVSAPRTHPSRAAVAAPVCSTGSDGMRIHLSIPARVSRRIVTLSGYEVAYFRELMQPGDHLLPFKLTDLSRGAYLMSFECDNRPLLTRLIINH